MTDEWKRILRPGHNCWVADARADASGLLIDAAAYYRAFYKAAKAARRYLLLAGWRFSSDLPIVRGREAEAEGREVRFLPLLNELCDQNPDLRVYVLAWDFSINYAREWEWFQRWKFERRPDDRLQFRFDDHHSTLGSHHQKFVVIDGQVGFVGGLDFCQGDWDDRTHRADNPTRCDPGDGAPHDPYHDVQGWVTGPAAGELGRYFQQRWSRATGEPLLLPPPPDEPPPPVGPSVFIGPAEVALSENRPKTLDDPTDVRQIRALYRDAFAAAERLIYMENQYFSSHAVFEALAARLRAADRPKLDVVLVMPKRSHTWVESVAMGGLRAPMIDDIRTIAEENGHRVGLYYPVSKGEDGRETIVLVHSKLLIIDDRFLTVGSCNASNRSMGLDTELNLSWEATSPDQHELLRGIRMVRAHLLMEHCGRWRDAEGRKALREEGHLVATLDAGASGGDGQCLRPLTSQSILEERPWVQKLAEWHFHLDPENPIIEEALYEAADEAAVSTVARGLMWFRDWVRGLG